MLVTAIFIIGASGLIAQILITRELIISFYGNELALGILLAGWIAAEAAGVLIFGKIVDRLKHLNTLVAFLQAAFCGSFLVCLYLSRTYKSLLGIPHGEGIGLSLICVASFVIMFPVAGTHGALFSTMSALYSRERAGRSAPLSSSLGIVYAWEILGTITGGFIVTYCAIPFIRAFDAAFLTGVTNAFITGILLFRRKPLYLAALAAVLIMPLAWWGNAGGLRFIETESARRQFGASTLLQTRNTVYGSLAVTKQGEQYTYFSNGLPIITVPYPDTAFFEDFVHIPLCLRGPAKEVLVIGAGAGGMLTEILKHPVERVDYLEIDPALIELLRTYPTPLVEAELSDPRVYIHTKDGRFFLRTSARNYDAIFIGVSKPADLATNRFFTAEFFRLARRHLTPDGILVLRMAGSQTYVSAEMGELNAIILRSLQSEFSAVRVIPGDYTIFVAGISHSMLDVTGAQAAARFADSGIATSFMSEAAIKYRLRKNIREWFDAYLLFQGLLNRDYQPAAVYAMNLFWNKEFSPHFFPVLKALDAPAGRLAAATAGSVLLILTGFFCGRRRIRTAVSWVIATTGTFGMLASLVLICAFQVHYGYLYHYIGLLVAIFMAGSAAGSIAMTRLMSYIRRDRAVMWRIEAGIIGFTIALPLILNNIGAAGNYAGIVFASLLFTAGALLGAEFPLAGTIYLSRGKAAGETAGALYCADLIGGCVAGVLGGVLLIPLFGISGTCMTIIIIKTGSLLGTLPR